MANHYSIFLLNKITNAISLSEIISNKIKLFSSPVRVKRGLINAIGKAQKWLFGTLDADDEKRIKKYMETLNSNDNKIQKEIKSQMSILRQISNKYSKVFQNLSDNQIIIETQLKTLSREVQETTDLQHAFSFSNIIDNLVLQLNSLHHIFDNLEIAISFGRLNILHTSIIEPQQIRIILSKLNKIYDAKTSLLITQQRRFLDNIRCPEIEDWYFCRQNNLHKNQPCLATLLRTGRNQCSGTNIRFSETSITQINSNQVLIIPAATTSIKSKCEIEGIHEVQVPCVVSMSYCTLSINGRYFQTEETTQEEFIFELPKMEIPDENYTTGKSLHLKHIDMESVKHINDLANNIIIPDLQNIQDNKHSWFNTTLVILIIISILATLAYLKIRSFKKQEIRRQSNQKINEPLFSSLGREELCS
ncbi:hypothetical protein HHI36_010360 [Cryptolaemus montrouzieri]|uniref:Envelope protein n=1 Tax=Cryptolaemus montrouzieri TaxID=559131 RepID=A0ABD2MIE4_9CUCU